MKLVRLRAWITRTPLAVPVNWTVGGTEDAAIHLWIELTDENGTCGLSETAVKPAWTGLDGPTALAAIKHIIWPRVSGQLPDAAVAGVLKIRGLLALHAAFSHALTDLKAAADCVNARLALVLPRDEPERMAETASAAAQAYGISIFKAKVGAGLTTDAAVLTAIRVAINPQAQLTLDANCAYGIEDGQALCRLAVDSSALFVEDPWPLAPDARTRDAIQSCACPVSADRVVEGAGLVDALLEIGISWLAVKPNRIGPTAARKIASKARAAGAKVVSGLFGEGPLGALQQLRGPLGDTAIEAGFHLGLTDPVSVTGLSLRDGRIFGPAGRASDLVAVCDIEDRSVANWEGGQFLT